MIGRYIDVSNMSKEEAINFITNKCNNCDIFYYCNGNDSKICNEKTNYLLDKYSENNNKEENKKVKRMVK